MDSSVGADERWVLHPQVALRPESFGALAYHFGTRRLTFLKHPDLVAVVRALASSASVGEALSSAGIDEPRTRPILAALQTLADGDMIRRPTTPEEQADVA